MPERCNQTGSEAAQVGDRYYRVIGQWIRGRMRSGVLRQQARRLAAAYRAALEKAIDCYRRIRRFDGAKRELQYARELKTLLNKDMELLGPAAGEINQPDQ